MLRKRYPNSPTSDIAKALDRKIKAVYQKAIQLGLRKSAAYLESPHACRLRRGDNIGASFRFLRGHVPANKGLRRPGWGPGRMKDTQFRKGEMAGAARKKWVPVGTEVVDADGYRKRKVSDDRTKPSRFNWKFLHVIEWEGHHGAVPPGHAICFRNGDKSDIRVENLELVRRAEASGAELLVMGCYGHSRLREFILGGATRDVLSHMRQPVLLSH